MPIAAIGSLALGAGTSALSFINAGKSKREARKYMDEIKNYKRQELQNPAERLSVSTLGSDMQREDLGRSIATVANQAAMGGSRAVIGFMPNAINQQMQQEAQIAANLDQQQAQINQAQVQGDAMVQNMQEQREYQDLAGLGQAYQTARAEQANWNNQGVNAMLKTAEFASKMDFGGGSSKGSGITPIQDKSAGLMNVGRATQTTQTLNNGGIVFNPNPFIDYNKLSTTIPSYIPANYFNQGN